MIEGRVLIQMSIHPRNIDGSRPRGVYEVEFHVTRFKQYLEPEIFPDGSVREHALVQFWSNPGGLHTVRAEDLILTNRTFKVK